MASGVSGVTAEEAAADPWLKRYEKATERASAMRRDLLAAIRYLADVECWLISDADAVYLARRMISNAEDRIAAVKREIDAGEKEYLAAKREVESGNW